MGRHMRLLEFVHVLYVGTHDVICIRLEAGSHREDIKVFRVIYQLHCLLQLLIQESACLSPQNNPSSRPHLSLCWQFTKEQPNNALMLHGSMMHRTDAGIEANPRIHFLFLELCLRIFASPSGYHEGT